MVPYSGSADTGPSDPTLSGFAWPPSSTDRIDAEVVDLRTATVASVDAGSSAPAPDRRDPATSTAASQASVLAAPFWRSTRVLVALLTALVAVESLVIALQLSRSETPTLQARTPALASASPAGSESVPLADVRLPSPPAVRMPEPGGGAAVESTGGELRVRTNGPAATVFVDGRQRGTTPVTVRALAPGPHRVRLVAGAASVEETVTIESGNASTLVVRLASAGQPVGWLDIELPFEAQLFKEGQLVGTSAQRRLQFPAGDHRFTLVNESLGYRGQERVRVKEGEVSTLRPEVPAGRLYINALPWAEVLIDGRPAGTTPLANIPVALGKHEIRFRHPEFEEQTRHVVVTALEPARIGVELGR